MVKSFEFDARIRARRAFREKSTWLLLASTTNAPLRPTRRNSFESPAESFEGETEARAVAAPWAIGVLNDLSGPPVPACALAGTATSAALSSVIVKAALRIAIPMRCG